MAWAMYTDMVNYLRAYQLVYVRRGDILHGLGHVYRHGKLSESISTGICQARRHTTILGTSL